MIRQEISRRSVQGILVQNTMIVEISADFWIVYTTYVQLKKLVDDREWQMQNE